MSDFPNLRLILSTLFNRESGMSLLDARGVLGHPQWPMRSCLQRELEGLLSDPSISWKELFCNDEYTVFEAESEEQARAFAESTILWPLCNPGQDRSLGSVFTEVERSRRIAFDQVDGTEFSAIVTRPGGWTGPVATKAKNLSEARERLVSIWGEGNVSGVYDCHRETHKDTAGLTGDNPAHSAMAAAQNLVFEDLPQVRQALSTIFNRKSGMSISDAKLRLRRRNWPFSEELKLELELALNDTSCSWRELVCNDSYEVFEAESDEDARDFVITALWEPVNGFVNRHKGRVGSPYLRPGGDISARIEAIRRRAPAITGQKLFGAFIPTVSGGKFGVSVTAADPSQAKTMLASVWGDENVLDIRRLENEERQLAIEQAQNQFFSSLPVEQACPFCGERIEVQGCQQEWRTNCSCGKCKSYTRDI